MRPCDGIAEPSSAPDVKDAREAFDESGEFSDMVDYISALARSDAPGDVRNALDRLPSALAQAADPSQRSQIAFLTVLAYYRLREDAKAVEAAEGAIRQHLANDEIKKIHGELTRKRPEPAPGPDWATLGAVGAVGAAALATVAGVLLFRRRK
jgi:hypothetical protein